ncbi:MAG: hypothetical protein QGG02_01340 [Gammaproteobacteria bacterium]|nr:hypothetical protein [Gammaproteobacteria bacterium]MDP6734313.1 hypothetical protein [Gammaproteobacteria bacterium]
MKFRISGSTLIKIGILLALLLLVPYVVPFAFEFLLMADFFGLEALLLFLIYQLKNVKTASLAHLSELKNHILATFYLLAGTYVFQPKVCISHAAGSSVLVVFTCSVAFALALWLPAIYLSAGVLS